MNEVIFIPKNELATHVEPREGESNLIGVNDDVNAVIEWLRRSCGNSKHTEESYSREAKRLIIYCQEIGKSFAELTARDVNDFYALLKNPPQHWIIEKDRRHNEPLKPTQLLRKEGLSQSSLAQTKTILKGLFTFLNDSGYVKGNCFAVAAKVSKPNDKDRTDKALSLAAWSFLEEWLDNRVEREREFVEKTKAVRDRWVIHLAYHTGMRKSSIVNTYMSDIYPKEISGKRYLHINFNMKGNKENSVLLSEEAIFRLKQYRDYLGLSDLPTSEEKDIPVVHSLNHVKRNYSGLTIIDALSGKGITNKGLSVIIEDALRLAHDDCEDEWIKAELKEASPHTFRHTCATHRLMNGASIESTQATLGHSRIETTMSYSHIQKDMLLEEQNKVSERMRERKEK